MKTQLERLRSTNEVSRDADYYKENIGKVKTVEEFLDNYRLYSYAMKAYGLEDMTYAKAFMKKVLESDLTDTASFANRLTDDRYKKFAGAFQSSSETKIVQTSKQIESVIDSHKQMLEDEEASVVAETAYFEANISKVTNVDQLLGNERMRNYVLNAFELDTKYWDKTHLTKVLTSDTSDPASYVNTLTVANKNVLKAFANAFNFNAEGKLDSGTAVQTTDQTHTVTQAYAFNVPSHMVKAAAEMNKDYFESKIGSITNVDQLVGDSRMLDYIKVAYNLQDVTLKSTIKNILTSDLSDPENYATTFGGSAYEALTKAFNFETDGSIASGETAQTSTQTAATGSLYLARYDDEQDAEDEDLYTYYRSKIGGMDSIEELKGTPKLYDFVLTAFGFDPNTTKDSVIEKTLTSDLNDPKSFANQQKDERYAELAAAFNFDADGEKTAPQLAQSQLQITQIAKDYVILKTRYGNADQKEKATEEASYYSENIQNITKVSELLDNKRLVNFVLEANGIDPKDVSKDFLKQIFASDLEDPESFVNQQDDHRFVEIVASFNFDTKGNIIRRDGSVQTRLGELNTEYLYLRQTLEEQTGEDSAGARLALYFKRMAPDINTAYDILGDTALLEVFRTAFSLPEEMSTMDIDKQKALVERFLDLEDLQDPEKLEKFIGRFTAMYDLANEADTNPVMSLFNSTGTISATTLLSIAQLKG
jgi:hypothetical protein